MRPLPYDYTRYCRTQKLNPKHFKGFENQNEGVGSETNLTDPINPLSRSYKLVWLALYALLSFQLAHNRDQVLCDRSYYSSLIANCL